MKLYNKAYINPRPFKHLSILFLKPLVELHAIILSSKLFHVSITLRTNENFLMSRRHLGLTNFKVCPLVGAVLNVKNKLGSVMSKPLHILKTSIMSPLNLYVSNVVIFKMFRRSKYDLFFKFGIILVALRCTI